MSNHVAPEGQIYVCAACGKRSKDRYGEQPLDGEFDESCMLNAVLCYDKKRFDKDGRLMWHAVEASS